MRWLALRSFVLACVIAVLSTGLFAWRWPATWRLPVRPFGTTNQPSANPRTPASEDLAPPSPALGWLLLIGVMALLFGGWLLLVLLT
ncbi:MAG: hypothetical protein WD359_05530 [Dehalococcoidia bacterium]